MKTFIDKTHLIRASIIVVLLAFVIVNMSSCKKEKQTDFKFNGYVVEFDIQTGSETKVVIEHWGTGIWCYMDGVRQLPAIVDNREIWGRRFIASSFIDSKWEYLGHDTVKPYNLIGLTNLQKDTIQINNP